MTKIIREDFDTFDAWARCAGDDSLREYRTYNRSRTSGEADFRGTSSLAEAVDLALYGWPAGRESMLAAMATVRPVRDTVVARCYDVAGSFPDISRAVAGDPMSMIAESRQQRTARPIVRIDYTRAVAYTVESQAIMNRGAALLGIVDQLESQGYSVELRLVFKRTGRADKYRLHSAVQFKRAGEPLDIDRAAFALVNPAVLRRLGQAICEQHREIESDMGAGYGLVDDSPLDDDAIFISGASNADLDPRAAWERMESAFAEYLDGECAA